MVILLRNPVRSTRYREISLSQMKIPNYLFRLHLFKFFLNFFFSFFSKVPGAPLLAKCAANSNRCSKFITKLSDLRKNSNLSGLYAWAPWVTYEQIEWRVLVSSPSHSSRVCVLYRCCCWSFSTQSHHSTLSQLTNEDRRLLKCQSIRQIFEKFISLNKNFFSKPFFSSTC